MRRYVPLLLALELTASCQSAPPPFEFVVEQGLARSQTQADARMLAILGGEYSDQVCSLLDVREPTEFVIHRIPTNVQGESGVRVWRNWSGRVIERRIEIGLAPPDLTRRIVAHEMVHWNAVGVWDRLPHAVEEGLADYVADRLAGDIGPSYYEYHEAALGKLTPAEIREALSLSDAEWPEAPPALRNASYAIGCRIVNALGIAGLRDLCVRAESEGLGMIPVDWLPEVVPD